MSHWESLFSPPTDGWRAKMWQRCQAVGFPSKKIEGFSYVPLAKWQAKTYSKAQETKLTQNPPNSIVFVNGVFKPELSSVPSSVVALPLSSAMRSYGLFLQNRLQKILKEETDFFALLNGACHEEGLFLYIPPKVVLTSPLQIVHISSEGTFSFPRIQCVVGKQGQAQILQTSADHDGSALFDCVLDEGARLDVYNICRPSAQAWQTAAFRALVKKEASLKALFFTTGAESVRTSFVVELAEENSEAVVKGLSLLSKGAESHVQGKIEHRAPHCRSRQHLRSVLYDASKASFEGKIFVHSAAQKTEAYQRSESLLLSPTATTFSKPNLEIFADDVKASHGATVSQLDKETLFYLRSRGLSLLAAQEMLIEGFCREFLQEFPVSLTRVSHA